MVLEENYELIYQQFWNNLNFGLKFVTHFLITLSMQNADKILKCCPMHLHYQDDTNKAQNYRKEICNMLKPADT